MPWNGTCQQREWKGQKGERKMNKKEKTRKMQTFKEKLNKGHSACRGSIKTQEDERQERFNLRI